MHRGPCPNANGLKDHPVGNIMPSKGLANSSTDIF